MNYIKELNAFREFLLEHELSAGAISLWHALMSINNKTRWKQQFNGPLAVVGQLAGLSKQGVMDAREKLLEHELIRYERGCPGKAPVYEMISLVPEPFDLSLENAADSDVLDIPVQSLSNDRVPHESRADNNVQDHTTWMAHFAELLAGAFVSLTDNRTSEKQAPIKDEFPVADDKRRHPWKEKPEDGCYLNRLPTSLQTGKSRSNESRHEKELFSGSNQKGLFNFQYSRHDTLSALLDPVLDQSADKYLTIRKQKQNKTKERQDRTTRAQLFSIYKENIGKPGKLVQTALNEWIQKMGEGIVLEAIKRTAKHGGKTFSYVEKILVEWEAEEIRTVEACRYYQREHDRRRTSRPVSAKRKAPTQGLSLFDELRKEAGV